jgi:predicted ABC-type ATPase
VPNITLSLDEETARWVKAHPEVRWSEVARQAIRRRIRELHALDAAFAESTLSEEDVERLAKDAKERLLRDVRRR